jgi:putative RNA ligase
MHINNLINPASLDHDLKAGFIRAQVHPTLPLKIYNYTEKAQFAKHWNKATLTCRGLITDDLGNIVARPFPKFFNWDEPKPKGLEFQMSMDEPVVVNDKLDGSLGILYSQGPGRPHAIATRGSFTSTQALHATKLWQERYEEEFSFRNNPSLTYLFEIIYPANRIVIDYKGLDDLVLLGAVDKYTGLVYGPDFFPGWPGLRATVYPYQTLREAVQARPRPGKEGFVVRSLSDGLMLKIKQEDYVRLHRIVTGLNAREIWRRCKEAHLHTPSYVSDWDVIFQDIPDELHSWVDGIARGLHNDVKEKLVTLGNVWEHMRPEAFRENREVRAEFARRIKPYAYEKWLQKALWIRYDGNDPREFIWSLVEPRGDAKPS